MQKGQIFFRWIGSAFSVMCMFGQYSYAVGSTEQNEIITTRASQQQAEQQRVAQEQKLLDTSDVVLQQIATKKSTIAFVQEERCFPIEKVTIQDPKVAMNLKELVYLAKQGNGYCFGVQNIKILAAALEEKLATLGYITSSVALPVQDLKSKELVFVVRPGMLGDTTVFGDDRIYTRTVLPFKKGDVLNVKALEQGIENIQRVPSAVVHIGIVPGKNPGESDIELTRKRTKFYRISANVGNFGSEATGKYQGAVSLGLDSLFGLSELLYFSAGRDLHSSSWLKSHNYMAYFSMPINYWTLTLSYSKSDYLILNQGKNIIHYSGISEYFNAGVSRLIYRDARQKTTMNYRIVKRDSTNFVEKTVLAPQDRHTAEWQLGIDHRHRLGSSVLNLSLNYRQGTRWFGAKPMYEERQKSRKLGWQGSGLYKIFDYYMNIDIPFKLKSRQLVYSSRIMAQYSRKPLTIQNIFNIGSRTSVRGFDGEIYLSASNGVYFQNDLAWYASSGRYNIYLGLDYGQIGGAEVTPQLGKRLAGGVVGMRGWLWRFHYDFYVGKPLLKPKGFKTKNTNYGFNITWNY